MSEISVKNVAAEKAVLAGLIQHGFDAFVDVQFLIEESTFTVDENKVIFKCLNKLFDTGQVKQCELSDILSVAQQLNLTEYIEDRDVLTHYKHLTNFNVHIDNIRPQAQKIRRLELTRDIQNELREIYKKLNDVDGDENVTEIVSIPETSIQEICLKYMTEDNSSTKTIGANIDEYLELLESEEEKSPGISTGFPEYDKAIGGGLRRGAVDLLGARAKAGKSTFSENVAVNITSRNIPVLVLDTEMTQEDHWNRLLANLSDVPINDIITSKFYKDPNKVKAVRGAAQKIKDLPYHFISVAGKGFDEILSITRRWLMKYVGYDSNGRMNDCVIIYDYMKLMTSTGISDNVAEYQALGFQITQLHNFCVEYDVPCLSFVQLNRDGITREAEDVVSGSDRLIWLCTSFSLLKARTEEEVLEESSIGRGINRRLVPIVSRHGPGPEHGSIYMRMTGDRAKLEEIGLRKDAESIHETEQQGFREKEPCEDGDIYTDADAPEEIEGPGI